ncbi:NAD(P)/FAD-dependent oxidoreductase [uncultured Litoreibacter sp.]|uniref:NAD(P)/FAD-dependent oxidoreductase n=1 Tax=uncultured Litoreibacter sp. TaxID=1392394 RepID=UPI00262B9A62|nr:NAD(P)/FAD-dependent oxidoreductase [uncultured Litoreibacter sp.]
MNYDVAILGAGAAGMFCAIEAGRRGRRVLLLDHAKSAGDKIRISGGGRCNFTNYNIAPEKFLSNNPRFALSALKRFTQWDFIAMVDAAGIGWHEKTLGQLFCDGSSKEIISMLLDHMAKAGVELRLQTQIDQVSRDESGYQILTSAGTIRAASVVVATGGKSIPKMGATGLGYKLAQQFGLSVTETRAGLVPLTFAPHVLDKTAGLSGLSVSAEVSHQRTRFSEGLLFTHRGLSGPSVLQISSYWREGDSICVDLCAGQDIGKSLSEDRHTFGRLSVKNALARHVPEKLAALMVAEAGVAGNLADQSKAALRGLAETVHNWQVTPSGSEGYRTAEVTLGGVDTDGLDARTMESKAVPGLYFIGEVVDVTGWLGGYNFQWAWSSGWAAGQVC